MKRIKKLKILLVAVGIMVSLSFINCYATEKQTNTSKDFNKNIEIEKQINEKKLNLKDKNKNIYKKDLKNIEINEEEKFKAKTLNTKKSKKYAMNDSQDETKKGELLNKKRAGVEFVDMDTIHNNGDFFYDVYDLASESYYSDEKFNFYTDVDYNFLKYDKKDNEEHLKKFLTLNNFLVSKEQFKNLNQKESFKKHIRYNFKKYIFEGGYFEVPNAENLKAYKEFFINNLLIDFVGGKSIVSLKVKIPDTQKDAEIAKKIEEVVSNNFNKSNEDYCNDFLIGGNSIDDYIYEIFLVVRTFIKFFDDAKKYEGFEEKYSSKSNASFILSLYDKFIDNLTEYKSYINIY